MQLDNFDHHTKEGKAFIYRSSAGSGKTFTLVKAYIKLLLLDPQRYHEVLAITFTNKAKDEMKSRIIEHLTELAKDRNTAMRMSIVKEFEEEGYERIKDVITSRANQVLNSLLHDYSRFNVSTIDHFFSQLIRHLAKELKLNLGYELDVDSKKALNESIELLFENADSELLNWLNDFSLDQIDNNKGWDIRKNIADLGKKLFQESYLDIRDALQKNVPKLGQFIKEQKEVVAKFRNELVAAAEKGVVARKKFNLASADFKGGAKGPISILNKLVDTRHKWTDQPTATFLAADQPEKWYAQKSSKAEEITKAFDAGIKDAQNVISMLYASDRYKRYLEANAILNYIHSYGVLASLAKRLQDYRSNNNLLLISDTAFILNGAITTAETPFIYEKIGSKYRYLLIDEFQDTSTYQWKSLLPFFQNALADGGQLFVVGDVKQSIYGWRGGDLNLLMNKIEDDIDLDKNNIRKLTVNRRSAQNVVAFNNSFFDIAPRILPLKHDLQLYVDQFSRAYEDVEQSIIKDYPGYVEIQFFSKTEELSWTELANKKVISTIHQAQQDGFGLNEVLLLTRKTDEARRIANYLLSKGIPAISESALRLTNSSKVALLVSNLRYLNDTDNKLAIAEYNHFYRQINGNTEQDLTIVQPLLEASKSFLTLPVYELVEELIQHQQLQTKTDIYQQRFLDICLAQSRKGNTSLTSFLDWWDEQEENKSDEFSLSPPENEQAVLVLTIHKAKGLEKPIVILPYADNELKPKAAPYWAKPLPEKWSEWGSLPLRFQKELAETDFAASYFNTYYDTTLEALNLLYVAFTRAGERLHIFSNADGFEKNSANLIQSVLAHDQFNFKADFDPETGRFQLGKLAERGSSGKEEVSKSSVISYPSSPLSQQLVVDQRSSDLFLSIQSEKSAKVKEGLVLHLVLSLIGNLNNLEKTLTRLVAEGFIAPTLKSNFKRKILLLFEKIPQLTNWFSDNYEVLNERKIISENEVHIPDRVMIKGDEAIIVDYKRQKKDIKHHNQLKRYADLLTKMGYNNIEAYLIYIDDQELERVI